MDQENQFRALLQENRDRIYRICCGYVRDENTRQDVFQTVLLHLWESLATFRGGSQVSTWIFRITVNTCLGYLRTQRREQRMRTEVEGQMQHAGVPVAPAPAETCQTRDDIGRLYDCIHQLPPVDRMLIALHLEEAGAEEMAEVLGITPGNARVRLHRAKTALLEIWERTGDGLE
ncbi:MAG: RNA polymerase sigma factor [Planctomycetes bacterium]|jgi:RNA polymerase sigma-70 factor (ECF subfamily)|nr:RNA polymerase sigma factor [Planctomycetota bacterium]